MHPFKRPAVAAVLATSLLAAAPSADAADRNGRFAPKGPGLISCEQLIQSFENQENQLLFLGWMTGFISGANVYATSTFDFAPWQPPELLANFVFQGCQQAPQEGVMQVVLEVMDGLRQTRLEQTTEVLTLESPDGTSVLYQGVLRQAQNRLKELDFYPGGIDGVYGPQTEASFRAFQEDRGLAVTGVPDQATMLALFYNIIIEAPAAQQAPADPAAAPEDEAPAESATPSEEAPADAAPGDGDAAPAAE